MQHIVGKIVGVHIDDFVPCCQVELIVAGAVAHTIHKTIPGRHILCPKIINYAYRTTYCAPATNWAGIQETLGRLMSKGQPEISKIESNLVDITLDELDAFVEALQTNRANGYGVGTIEKNGGETDEISGIPDPTRRQKAPVTRRRQGQNVY